jgi:geranylgeranyl diphosphate synthase type II
MENIKKSQLKVKELIISDISTNLSFKHNGNFINTHIQMDEIIKYSLNSGKRLRPIIIGSICNWENNGFILFVEYIHNASLIIDDLPFMDNDDERRGKPSLHKKYGVYIAHLTSQSLISSAMNHFINGLEKVEYKYNPEDFKTLRKIINDEINFQMGFPGLCGGQMLDLLLSEKKLSHVNEREKYEIIFDLIKSKTGSLFALSFMLGWIANGNDMGFIYNIKDLGYEFGLCYQIIDDIKDVKKDKEKNMCNNNICKYYTRNQLVDIFRESIKKIVDSCELFHLWNPTIKELVDYLIISFKKNISENQWKSVKINENQ